MRYYKVRDGGKGKCVTTRERGGGKGKGVTTRHRGGAFPKSCLQVAKVVNAEAGVTPI